MIIKIWKVISVIILILVVILICLYFAIGKWPEWTGFGEYFGPTVPPNQTFQRAKTLWDLMQLLIIPAILVIGAYWLNESARKREQAVMERRVEIERKNELDNRQEAALQTYLDKMTELLLKDKICKTKNESEVSAVARARTLTVLRRLDKDRKGALMQFLHEADLINKNNRIMSKADLSKADLSKADLSKANLRGANLYRAHLDMVDLRGARYTKNAKDIRDTIWPEGFDPDTEGAICEKEKGHFIEKRKMLFHQ